VWHGLLSVSEYVEISQQQHHASASEQHRAD
jgi:hypothetical protein